VSELSLTAVKIKYLICLITTLQNQTKDKSC